MGEYKLSIKQGGLGLRSLTKMNVALQGKWMWRFLKEENKMWKRVIDARWGRLDGGGGVRGDKGRDCTG